MDVGKLVANLAIEESSLALRFYKLAMDLSGKCLVTVEFVRHGLLASPLFIGLTNSALQAEVAALCRLFGELGAGKYLLATAVAVALAVAGHYLTASDLVSVV